MTEIIALIGVFIIGIIAGFFGSTVGGGSLLSIPLLIFIGLPPQMAIATDRFGGIGTIITAFLKFHKANKIIWKYIPLLAILSLAGAIIGANILLNINPKVLQGIAGILLLVLLPFLFLKRDTGIQRKEAGNLKMALGSVVYFLIQVFTGFFGAGTGPFIFYTLMIAFGLTIIEAVATQLIPLLILFTSSLIIFALKGIINYQIGIILLAGMATGGYIGAYVALKKGNTWLKGIFALMVVMAAVKLLFL